MTARKRIVLHAGDYCFGDENLELHTLLGSCVSVTLWHPAKKIGGMCHFALPNKSDSEDRDDHQPNPRYGGDCFALFARSVKRYHTLLNEYEAKIFGGGNIIKKSSNREFAALQSKPVGEKNVQVAFEFLLENDIEMKVAHVGEFGYRKIIFDIGTGDVWVKFTSMDKVGNQDSLTGRT